MPKKVPKRKNPELRLSRLAQLRIEINNYKRLTNLYSGAAKEGTRYTQSVNSSYHAPSSW